MEYFDYTDRGEQTLERMLIWWGTVVTYYHHPNCTESGHFGVLHCCEGDPERNPRQGLEATTFGPARLEDAQISVAYTDGAGNKVEMEPGDRLVYRDGKIVLERW